LRNTNSNAHAYSHPDAYGYTYTNAYTYGDTNTYADCNAYTYTYARADCAARAWLQSARPANGGPLLEWGHLG